MEQDEVKKCRVYHDNYLKRLDRINHLLIAQEYSSLPFENYIYRESIAPICEKGQDMVLFQISKAFHNSKNSFPTTKDKNWYLDGLRGCEDSKVKVLVIDPEDVISDDEDQKKMFETIKTRIVSKIDVVLLSYSKNAGKENEGRALLKLKKLFMNNIRGKLGDSTKYDVYQCHFPSGSCREKFQDNMKIILDKKKLDKSDLLLKELSKN